MATGYQEAVLRPRGGQVIAVAVVAVCLILTVGLVLGGDAGRLVRFLPAIALVAVGAVAVFWLPSVRIDPAAVEVRNILSTTRITWPAIEDVETRWSLVIATRGRRTTAWAAPRGSAIAAGRATRRDLRTRRAGGTVSPDAAREAGSLTASLVLAQWMRYRDEGLLGAVEGEGVETRVHTATAVVLVALAVLAALGLVA